MTFPQRQQVGGVSAGTAERRKWATLGLRWKKGTRRPSPGFLHEKGSQAKFPAGATVAAYLGARVAGLLGRSSISDGTFHIQFFLVAFV